MYLLHGVSRLKRQEIMQSITFLPWPGRTQYLFDHAFFQAYQFLFILFVSMDIMTNIEIFLMNILIYFLMYVYTGIYIMSHPNLDSRVGDT